MKESFLKTDLGQKLFEHLESFVLEMVYVTKSFQKRKEKKKKKEKEKRKRKRKRKRYHFCFKKK